MSHSIEKSANLIKITYWGTLTIDDLQEVVKNAIDNSDFADRIEDMRKLEDITIGFKELLFMSQNLQKMGLPHIVKTAVVTGSPLQYGIARMFQTILTNPQMKIKIFVNEEDAANWLLSGD